MGASLRAGLTAVATRDPGRDTLAAIVTLVDLPGVGAPVVTRVLERFPGLAISRNGVTFRYTENGPQGLVTGKKVFLALARGGRYQGTSTDSQTPYLKTILGFLGMSDVVCIHSEGLNMGPEAVKQGFAEAEKELLAALP